MRKMRFVLFLLTTRAKDIISLSLSLANTYLSSLIISLPSFSRSMSSFISFAILFLAFEKEPAAKRKREIRAKGRKTTESGNLSIVSNRIYSLPELSFPSFFFIFLPFLSLFLCFLLALEKDERKEGRNNEKMGKRVPVT